MTELLHISPFEIIGWTGATLFMLCGLPLAWQTYKDGHAHGVNMLFLQMWLWGEILTIGYTTWLTWDHLAWPLLANYVMNIVFIIIILRYKWFPRESST